ncbi:MAG: helix-turn-helix transcriptional regulator [Hyphomicrobiaceae bacterium]|nr:helix-turn-helix transcriptional regulator [Hyphomicrobiaceae bacterium]
MTQAELADAADCHEKTVQNLLAGRTVRDQTLFDVCVVLGLDFEETKALWIGGAIASEPTSDEPHQPGASSDMAPVYMGAYTRAAVDHYIGSYLTLRPSFTMPDTIFAFRTDITWDDAWPSLVFEERNRPDAPYSHRGRVHVPPSSQYIHFVSLTKGAMRMIVLTQFAHSQPMRGLITTLSKSGATIRPVSAPISYMRIESTDQPEYGEIRADSAAYAGYRAELAGSLNEGFVALVSI